MWCLQFTAIGGALLTYLVEALFLQENRMISSMVFLLMNGKTFMDYV